MTEEEEYRIAERLAEALGYELVEFRTVFGTPAIRFLKEGWKDVDSYAGEWFRRKDVMRGEEGGRKGILDLGTRWLGLDLPKGITRRSTNEEIDLILSVMGF